MQTISISLRSEKSTHVQQISISERLQKLFAAAEENRFGLTAALILLQVSIAGFNVVVPPMVGASVYLMAPGIFMAFMSNSMALAQVKMKWVLIGFVLSMNINAAVSIYCLAQL